jgi:hypothetical protein
VFRKDEKMQTSVFRVDTRMIPPVVLAMGLGIALLVLEGPSQRTLFLALLLSPFYYLGAEILVRRITIEADGITIRKLFRSVRLSWAEVERLDAVQSGSKIFIIIQGHAARPALITNTIRPFDELARKLMDSLPAEKISPSAAELLSHPPAKLGPLVQAWIICLVLGACVAGNLLGFG